MKKTDSCVCGVGLLILACESFAAPDYIGSQFDFTLSFEAGYRQDDLSWNEAGPGGSPNVLSELMWRKMDVAYGRIFGDFSFQNRYYLKALAGFGEVSRGENRDTDYFGDNRTLEFSRSDNQAGGDVRDFSFGGGVKFHWNRTPVAKKMTLIPLVGYAYHLQDLTITDGFQSNPPTGEFPGLNSSYDTLWKGAWYGLDLLFDFNTKWGLNLGFEYHPKVNFTAEADWNLNTNFQRPLSFAQETEAKGFYWKIDAFYRWNERWNFTVLVEKFQWQSKNGNGTDTTFLANGTSVQLPLNEVTWNAMGILLGVTWTIDRDGR